MDKQIVPLIPILIGIGIKRIGPPFLFYFYLFKSPENIQSDFCVLFTTSPTKTVKHTEQPTTEENAKRKVIRFLVI